VEYLAGAGELDFVNLGLYIYDNGNVRISTLKSDEQRLLSDMKCGASGKACIIKSLICVPQRLQGESGRTCMIYHQLKDIVHSVNKCERETLRRMLVMLILCCLSLGIIKCIH
jgi:hypothetical protein